MKKQDLKHLGSCMGMIKGVADALYVLNGKWKIPILISLCFGTKRFKEIAKDIPKITDRMLSKELRELELNHLVTRTVYDTMPVTIEYSLTQYASSLDNIIQELSRWGDAHRKRVIKKAT